MYIDGPCNIFIWQQVKGGPVAVTGVYGTIGQKKTEKKKTRIIEQIQVKTAPSPHKLLDLLRVSCSFFIYRKSSGTICHIYSVENKFEYSLMAGPPPPLDSKKTKLNSLTRSHLLWSYLPCVRDFTCCPLDSHARSVTCHECPDSSSLRCLHGKKKKETRAG